MTESRSALPAMLDTATDIGILILLFPVLIILMIIGPGLWIWFFNPWGVLYAVFFYNILFIALGVGVYRDPDNMFLRGLWVFQMITAYLGVLLTCPTEL